MSFQYALECSIQGNNPDIKDAISIDVVNELPCIVCDEGATHAGISSGSSIAQGDFCPEFIVVDKGKNNSASDMIALSTSRNKTPQKMKLTRYTVIEEVVTIDLEYQMGSTATKLKSTLYKVTILMIDCSGHGIIQPH